MQTTQLYFKQDCPVCGRGMRVRIELLGKQIACAHCMGVSLARVRDEQSLDRSTEIVRRSDSDRYMPCYAGSDESR